MNIRLHRHIAIPLLIHAVLFVFVVGGVLPRSIVPFWTIALLLWAAAVPSTTSLPFFIAAIPLFIAIPITATYDNLTMWRPLSCVIMGRWFFLEYSWRMAWRTVRTYLRAPFRHLTTTLLLALLAITILSLLVASDPVSGGIRILYFINIVFVPILVWNCVRTYPEMRPVFFAAITWSLIAVIGVAFIQLASVYLMDVYGFMRLWGEGIQLRQFGVLWSQIATRVGNTWLAYYGPQLSLRVFSLFPDSHSFPLYVLLALGAALTFMPLPSQHHRRSRSLLLLVPLSLLAVILSGTRGVWAASVGIPAILLIGTILMKRFPVAESQRVIWKRFQYIIATYFFLFLIAWPIFISPQFLLHGGDRNLLGKRLRSIIDFGETSNHTRILIWKATLSSIAHHPLLGVGIGNFPVVLDQPIVLAKAGSSAHNIWLHIAAELGITGLLVWVFLYGSWMVRAVRQFYTTSDWRIAVYAGWMILVLPWIAAYLLTDAALFDERLLLLFGVSLSLLLA